MGQGLSYVQCDGTLKFRYVRLAASNIRCDITPSFYFAFTTQEFYERTQRLQIGHGMPDRACALRLQQDVHSSVTLQAHFYTVNIKIVTEQTWRCLRIWIYIWNHSIISLQDGGYWPASCCIRFTPFNALANTNWTGGWLEAGTVRMLLKENFEDTRNRTTIPLSSSPYSGHSTDWAISNQHVVRTFFIGNVARKIF